MPVRKTQKSSIRQAQDKKAKSQKLSIETVVAPIKQVKIADKLKQPRIFVSLIILALIILAFSLKGLFVAALVNGQPISRIEILKELEKQGGKQALTSLVNQTLILQEAKKKNVEATQKELEDATKQIEDSLKTQGQSLDTVLSMQGMTRNDLVMQLKLRTLVEKLLGDKISVSDKEIADYIEENKDTFPSEMKEDEIRKSVAEQLKQQKMGSESQKWLEELNKNAKVNYFVNY